MWTQERTQLLRESWAEGHSASQIAKQLGGVTRNAVIGKVHRLGLPKRADRQTNSTGRTERVRQKRAARRARPPQPRPARKEVLPADLAAIRTLPMSDVYVCDIAPRMCKYMAGDPAIDARFCGRATQSGRVYCADHAALCYVPPDPKKKPRAR